MVAIKILFTLSIVILAVITATYARTQKLQLDSQTAESQDRDKRDHHGGVTGPVHTFVKTDKHAHFKWGVRHHVGHQYGR